MTTDLAGYLASKGIKTFRGSGTEITAHCWWCPDGDPKRKGKLYMNAETWLYDCKRCGEHGGRASLLKHFGDSDDITYMPGTDPAIRRRILSEATDLAADMLLSNPKILDALKDRGLSMSTIVDARLGYLPGSWSLVGSLRGDHSNADLIGSGLMTAGGQDFLSGNITIPYQSHGDVVQLRGKAPDGKYVTPPGDHVRLFNADALRDVDQVIVTEGEFDCLIVAQNLALATDSKLRGTAVVGIAGAGSLPLNFPSYFEGVRRVYLALDPDDAGQKAALKIKDLLGSKARIVHLPADLPKCDWTEYLRERTPEHPHGGHGWRDIASLLADAEAEGRRLFTAWDAYLSWRKVEDNVGGIRTGFGEVDAWITPGIKPGQLMIPLAKTGTGKTNFLTNIAWNARSRHGLFISLEMTKAEIYERLRRIALFWNPLASDEEIAHEFANLRIVDTKLRPGDLPLLCDEYEDETGMRPQLAFVDYIGYFAASIGSSSSQYERVTKAVITLKEEAKQAEVAIIAPHQVSRMAEDGKPISSSDARDSGAIEETADMLLALFRPGDALERQEGPQDARIRVQMLKNRNGQKNRTTTLNFSTASLTLVDAATNESRIVDDENRMIWRGEDYDAVRRWRAATAGRTNQLRLAT